MCSNTGSRSGSRSVGAADGPASGQVSGHAPTIAAELHAVLDRLLAADLSGLSSDEHSQLVTRVLRAQDRLHAGALDAIGAFDAADVAATSPHRTTKRWIELRTRTSPATASQLTRTARAVRDHLPATRDALGRGLISGQHAAAVVSVVSTVGVEHAVSAEPILLDLARQFAPSVVREAAARIHQALDPAGAEKALNDAHAKRGVRLSVGGAYGYLSGVLDLESTELLQSALMPLMAKNGPDDARTVTQLRADALLDLAKRGLDTGLDTQLGGERAHLSVVIDEDALRSGAGSIILPWTGAALPAATARRWSCDAQLTPILARRQAMPAGSPGDHGAGGNGSRGPGAGQVSLGAGWLPLDVGRAARTVTSAQTKALRVRDGGCVYPGCPRTPAFCDAHHVQHWADGGATSLDNMVLVCRHHHRTLHQGLWSLSPDTGQPGMFWASTADWGKPAQSASHRSPPIHVDPALSGTRSRAPDPARSLWQT